MSKKVVNLIGYIATIVIMLSLACCKVFANYSTFVLVMTKIAEVCAFAVTVTVGFYFAREKRSKVWLIILIVCAISIAVLLFV